MTSAKADCFLDTNVLIYAATGKRREPVKHAIAFELIATRMFGLSAQSLAEFYAVTQKPKHGPLPKPETDAWLAGLSEFPIVSVDALLVRRGIAIARQYGLRYYDAALLAAAERHGVPTFYSEDLNHGQLYASVRVINPFLD